MLLIYLRSESGNLIITHLNKNNLRTTSYHIAHISFSNPQEMVYFGYNNENGI